MDHIQQLQAELSQRANRKAQDVYQLITNGRPSEAVNHFFFCQPTTIWLGAWQKVLDYVAEDFGGEQQEVQGHLVSYLILASIGLKSFLCLARVEKEIGKKHCDAAYDKTRFLLKDLQKSHPSVMQHHGQSLVTLLTNQYVAEGLGKDEALAEAKMMVANGVLDYIDKTIAKINSSNFYRYLTKARNKDYRTVLGNDYAEFLQYSMWLGYTFQTTNPPLINMAWDLDPDGWAKSLKGLVPLYGDPKVVGIERYCSLAAMLIVEKSCRLLRDWFLFTEGREGFVCFQVNPENHDDSQAMVEEARFVYEQLGKRLGGIPNVSFKLPGTHGGLIASKILTEEGISVTITLEFGLFQAVEFAKAFGPTVTPSSLVVMNGRLSFPVRDELSDKKKEDMSEAYRYAGVEVTRTLYRFLKEMGGKDDTAAPQILNASLRIYGTEIPDISEIWGTSSITVFPNVRRAYDATERNDAVDTVTAHTDAQALKEMRESEIFQQAIYLQTDDSSTKPERPLSMEKDDNDAVLAWEPIALTLAQFKEEYQKLKTVVTKVLESE